MMKVKAKATTANQKETVVKSKETHVSVRCDGQGEIGVLAFDLKNRLLWGARGLPPYVVMMIMVSIRCDKLFGRFNWGGRTYRYKDLDLDLMLNPSAPRREVSPPRVVKVAPSKVGRELKAPKPARKGGLTAVVGGYPELGKTRPAPNPPALVSPPMERLFRHVLALPSMCECEPVSTDEVAGFLDTVEDGDLISICGESRLVIDDELYDIELTLQTCGWLVELLGEAVIE